MTAAAFDTLRPPAPLDPTRDAYKDWLHLNVLDPGSGLAGLFNVSLHGAPEDPRSRAIGTALLHRPQDGWLGNVEVCGRSRAHVGTTSIALERVALAVDHRNARTHVSARLPADRFRAQIVAGHAAPPVRFDQRMPFGQGWISWFLISRMTVSGSVTLGDVSFDLEEAVGYHDHNWGRWRWGDDIGWEWGVFAAGRGAPLFAFSRATNRSHGVASEPFFLADLGHVRRQFRGPSVTLSFEGTLGAPLRRLPGALAALHQDRMRPALPACVRIAVDDGLDRAALEFEPHAAGQLIAGEPTRAGYGFVHELVGDFRVTGRVAARRIDSRGLGVFEYVD